MICLDSHDLNVNVDVSPTLISGGNDKPRTPIVVIGIDVYNLCTTGGGVKNIDKHKSRQ